MTALLPSENSTQRIDRAVPQSPTSRRLPGWLRTLRMARFELGLVFRQRSSMLSVVLAPLFVLVFPFVTQPSNPDMWRMLLPPMTVLVMVFSVYYTAASLVATRRQLQLFKRLRTTELTTTQMITSMTTPLVLIGVVQAALIVAGFVVLGGPPPSSYALLALAVLTTAVLCVVAGVAIGSISPNSERVQYAAMPLMLATAILANLLMNPVHAPWHGYLLFAPFMGGVDLVARAAGLSERWLVQTPLPVNPVAFDVATSVFWLIVFGFAVVVTWRWDSRK